MLTHVVCFKFGSLDHAHEACRRLLSLQGQVPTLREIEAGVDITRSERSYDLALITRFDDEAGMDAYQVHPAHQEVVAYIRSVAMGAVAVDFT